MSRSRYGISTEDIFPSYLSSHHYVHSDFDYYTSYDPNVNIGENFKNYDLRFWGDISRAIREIFRVNCVVDSFNVSSNLSVKDNSLRELIATFDSVTKLDISYCTNISSDALMLLPNIKKLSDLNISGLKAVESDLLRETLGRFSSLKILNLSNCICLDDNGLILIAKYASYLEQLVLRENENITHHGVNLSLIHI